MIRMLNTIGLNSCQLNVAGVQAKKSALWRNVVLRGFESIAVENAKANSISSLMVYGASLLSGNPAPSAPVAFKTNRGSLKYGVLGNNLLNIKSGNIVNGKYLNNVGEEALSAANFYVAQFIKVKPSTAYTASFSKQIGYFSFMEYDANFNFLKRTLVGESGKKISSCTHTMGGTTAYVVVGSNPTSAALTEDEILAIKWMFCEGADVLPYEDYRAGFYTDGEDVVSVRNKNLNAGVLQQKGFTSTGGESASTTFCGTLHKIKVTEGEKYTISFGGFPDGASGVFVNTWKTDGSWNARQAISSTGKLTYTIPEGVGEVNFTLYKTGGITIGADSWMQVELGTEATEYVPAFYEKADVELLLSINMDCDSQNIISGEVTKLANIIVFDGTETFSLSSGTINHGIADKLKKANAVMCTHYPFTSASAANAADKTIKSYASQNIGFKDSNFPTVADFVQFLAQEYAKGTPVMVIYYLAEEKKTSVDPQKIGNPAGNFDIVRSCEALASYDGKEMQVTLKVKVQQAAGGKEITFTVDGYDNPFKAKDGMNWMQFCASAYNTEGWESGNGSSWVWLYDEGSGWSVTSYYLNDLSEDHILLGEDTIKDGHHYTWFTEGGIGGGM